MTVATRSDFSFDDDGLLVSSNYVPQQTCDKLADWLESRPVGDPQLLPSEDVVSLILSPEIARLVGLAFGNSAVLFHHAHGRVLEPGAQGKPWHHDYDGHRDSSGYPLMAHIMIYPRGLADVPPLIVRPGSHKEVVPRHIPVGRSTSVEGDCMTLNGDEPFVVLMNSALWHMRPAHTGTGRRYDMNISFCQDVPGHVWQERTHRYKYQSSYSARSCLFRSPEGH